MNSVTESFLYRLVCCQPLHIGDSVDIPDDKRAIFLVYCTEGQVSLRVDNCTVFLSRNHLYLFTSTIDIVDSVGNGYLLTITGGASFSFSKTALPLLLTPSEPSPLLTALSDICYLYHNDSEIALSDSISRFLHLILTEEQPKHKENDLQDDMILQCMKYLETNFSSPFRLTELAEHIGISKYYLSRLFSSKTGKTLHEYHTECRIRESKRLLLTPTLSLSTICERLGFVDMSHFSKTFSTYENMTPAQYRKKFRGVSL